MNRWKYMGYSRRTFLLGSTAATLVWASNGWGQDRPSGGLEEESEGRSDANYADEWRQDRRAWVRSSPAEAESAWHIVGDHVILDATDWSALDRPNGAYLSGKTVLSIEARELTINMPLRFDDGGLIVNAKEVRFGSKGLISFRPPKDGYDQQFLLTAQLLSFEGGRKKPFAFTLNSSHRKLSIKVEELSDQTGRRASDSDAAFAMLVRSSFPEDSVGSVNSSKGGPIVSLLEGGRGYYDLLNGACWPEATALKLQRFFARAPYDAKMHAFVQSKLEDLEPVLAAQQSGMAIRLARHLAWSIERRRDLFGLLETDVPMTPFKSRIERFEKLLNDLYGTKKTAGELGRWDEIYSLASKEAKIDVKALKWVLDRISLLESDIRALGHKADELNRDLSDIEDEIVLIDGAVLRREEYIKEQITADALEKGNLEAGVQAITLVANVAFPHVAPFITLASGLLSAEGALAASNGDVPSAVVGVANVIENHAKIKKLSESVRNNFNDTTDGKNLAALRKNVTDPKAMTDVEKKNLAKFGNALAGMASSSKELLGFLGNNPASAPIEFDAAEIASDQEIVELFKRRNMLISRQTKALEARASVLIEYERANLELLESIAMQADLQALKQLTNDQENLRFQQIADTLRQQAVASLAREAVLLRRAVRYVTGNDIDLPEDVLFFAEGQAAEQGSSMAGDAAKVDEALRAERIRQAGAYHALLRRARDMRNWLAQATGQNSYVPITFRAHLNQNSGTNAQAKQQFVQELNRLISEAIHSGGRSGRIPIPLNVSVQTQTTERSVLAGINVSELTFVGKLKPDAQVILVVEHPRVGTIYRDGRGEIYSDASVALSDNAPEKSSWPISLDNPVQPDWNFKLTLDKLNDQISSFAGPFFAPYSVSIDVPSPESWTSDPMIESIKMDFIIRKLE